RRNPRRHRPLNLHNCFHHRERHRRRNVGCDRRSDRWHVQRPDHLISSQLHRLPHRSGKHHRLKSHGIPSRSYRWIKEPRLFYHRSPPSLTRNRHNRIRDPPLRHRSDPPHPHRLLWRHRGDRKLNHHRNPRRHHHPHHFRRY